MPRSTNYYDDLKESFQKNPSEAATYLEVVIEEGEPKMLRLDLALSNTGVLELYSLVNLLDELGFQLAVNFKGNSVVNC